MDKTLDFYNYFADVYSYIFTDWERSSKKHPIIIDTIIKQYQSYKVKTILDCTCGIGTQCLGLPSLGYETYASDISIKELEIACAHSAHTGNKIQFKIADCRLLEKTWDKHFDTIISFDNALPHLTSYEDMKLALTSIYNMLNNKGLFLASFRDYDNLLKERPIIAHPLRIHTLPDKTIYTLKTWNWENNFCRTNQYIIIESKDKNDIYHGSFLMWAITRKELFEIAAECGFTNLKWLLPSDTDFFEPIMLAQKEQ